MNGVITDIGCRNDDLAGELPFNAKAPLLHLRIKIAGIKGLKARREDAICAAGRITQRRVVNADRRGEWWIIPITFLVIIVPMVKDTVSAANYGLRVFKWRPCKSKAGTRHYIVIFQQISRQVQPLQIGWRKNAIQRITCSRLNLSIGKADWRLRRLLKNRAEARHVVVLVIADGRTLLQRLGDAETERQTRRIDPRVVELEQEGI